MARVRWRLAGACANRSAGRGLHVHPRPQRPGGSVRRRHRADGHRDAGGHARRADDRRGVSRTRPRRRRIDRASSTAGGHVLRGRGRHVVSHRLGRQALHRRRRAVPRGRAEHELTPEEHDLIGRMLERSDDDAANTLWNEYGGPEIVETSWPIPTHRDHHAVRRQLVEHRDHPRRPRRLLRGTARRARRTRRRPAHRDPQHLRASNATSTEGYDQRFGLPDGLGAETTLAVKQGWMCCIDDRWTHVSTGIVGEDDRYVLVVVSGRTSTTATTTPTTPTRP